MGKNLIQQARGKGSPRYKAPSFNYAGEIAHKQLDNKVESGIIKEIIHCPGHSAPLMKVQYEDGQETLLPAPEGVRVNDKVHNNNVEVIIGNTLPLKDIPEGTSIYNIEHVPGDGGKFVRASGTFAKIVGKTSKGIEVKLPSKKMKIFSESCRAIIGTIAGGGRTEKPMLKAGNAVHKWAARNKLYPIIGGNSQNAVDHPFGKGRSAKKGRPTVAPRNSPPGANVGKMHPRRTGYRR